MKTTGTKDATKQNKLIAEFMGFKMLVSNYGGINIIESPSKATYDLFGLKYNKSWDWLIPVIDKIYSMDEYPKYVYKTNTIVSKGGIYINTRFIEETFEQVVDFIEWYNSNL